LAILLLVLGDQGNKTTMPWILGFWTTHKHDKHKWKEGNWLSEEKS
jgi:hypothetical protein